VNTGRQAELDLAKTLAVFYMIATHVQETFLRSDLLDNWFNLTLNFGLGAIAGAQVLMFVLGIGIVYSHRSAPGPLARRGIFLLVLVDIFHFAGLAFLFFAFWRLINLKDHWLMLILGICFLGNTWLESAAPNFADGTVWGNSVSGLFWGTGTHTYFPFVPWITYPICGYHFGKLLIQSENKQLFYRKTAEVSLPILLVILVVIFVYPGFDVGQEDICSYYHHGLSGAILLCSLTTLWLALLYPISGFAFLTHNKLISRWSQNVTLIYFVHWVVIGWIKRCRKTCWRIFLRNLTSV
jgi:uncharacterized membrane protein